MVLIGLGCDSLSMLLAAYAGGDSIFSRVGGFGFGLGGLDEEEIPVWLSEFLQVRVSTWLCGACAFIWALECTRLL